MGLKINLSPDCMGIGFKSRKKEEVLMEISELAKNNIALENYEVKDIYNAFMEREELGSTGFGGGIAIPHCRLKDMDSFVVGAIVDKQGVDFESVDNKPTNIFFFMIGPDSERSKHIKLLSEISKVLKADGATDKILSSGTTSELYDNILAYVHEELDDDVRQEKVLFHVFIQKEEYFEEILEEFSSDVDGSIAVIETKNAGDYLNKMPLFSAYWADSNMTFSRVIIAVADKAEMDSIISRINSAVGDIENTEGILVSVSPLLYTAGSIDF